MLTTERRHVIVSALRLHGTLSVVDLSRLVGASEITVRRDLRTLEAGSLVVRQRGGARLSPHAMDEPSYADKSEVAAAEKAAIATTAATLVDDGDVLLLGPGSTTQFLARALVRRRLLVVTTSLLVANELAEAPDVEVYLTGGSLRSEIRAVVGGETESCLARLHVDKAFLSGNGLTPRRGLTTPSVHVAGVDRAAARAADRVVALVDHTKIDRETTVQTVAPPQLHAVVTDWGTDATALERLRARGVEVHVAPRDASVQPARADTI